MVNALLFSVNKLSNHELIWAFPSPPFSIRISPVSPLQSLVQARLSSRLSLRLVPWRKCTLKATSRPDPRLRRFPQRRPRTPPAPISKKWRCLRRQSKALSRKLLRWKTFTPLLNSGNSEKNASALPLCQKASLIPCVPYHALLKKICWENLEKWLKTAQIGLKWPLSPFCSHFLSTTEFKFRRGL